MTTMQRGYFKILPLVVLLWAFPALCDNATAAPSLQCKSALDKTIKAYGDMEAAFKMLEQAMDKTDAALDADGRAFEKLDKALEVMDKEFTKDKPGLDEKGRSFIAASVERSQDETDRTGGELTRAQAEEKTARDELKRKIEAYDGRVDSYSQCERRP